MNYLGLVSDARFFTFLSGLDREFSFDLGAKGCQFCGGPLHQAHFKRQGYGYGLPDDAPEETRIRFSFCCGADGCRRRMTPPSLRFLRYRAFLAITFILVSAFHHGLTDERFAEVRALYDVSRRTIERWLKWWRDVFPVSEVWRGLRGRIIANAEAMKNLPSVLLAAFDEPKRDLQTVMIFMLKSLMRPL